MKVSHSFLPSAREYASIERRWPLPYPVVRKIRSPHTIGDELPRPGTVVFHTPDFAFHVSAYVPGATWPCPDGPRQRGQYFAPSPVTSIMRTSPGAAASIAAATRSAHETRRGFI